ncbi:MAG: hydrogenase maturation protease [Gaiellaceae bacterium]|jgi:hydrogenase maturation protease|nr:hydrogenase maturation protease [Gaiellaceae bacterium]
MNGGDFWEEQSRPGPESATVDGRTIRKGSRVRLRPRAGGDIFDLALADKLAVVDRIDEDAEGKLHVSVTVDDDPGRDLGAKGVLGHRFFFDLEEVEPTEDSAVQPSPRARILVAGIGNIFLGDDGFGVEVAQRLAARTLPAGVEVRDFGIRGMDLAYQLQEEYDTVVFVDAAPRGEPPGTVSLIEPELDLEEVVLDTHGMDPLRVLALANALGRIPDHVLVVACEPEVVIAGEHDEDLVGELSEPVAAAVDQAVELVITLVADLMTDSESNRKAVPR